MLHCTCPVCKEMIAVDELCLPYQVCATCYTSAKIINKLNGTPLGQALIELAEAFRQERLTMGSAGLTEVPKAKKPEVWEEEDMDEDDEVLVRVVVKQADSPLSSEEYRELEYEFLELDVAEFDNPRDELIYYEQLMDAALAGRDIEWAKTLHKQLTRLKERMA